MQQSLSVTQPTLILHALPSQTVFGLLSRRHIKLCHFILKVMDQFLAGEDHHQLA